MTFIASNLNVVNTISGPVNLLESFAAIDDNLTLTIDSFVNGSIDPLFLVSSDDMVITTLSTGGPARIQGLQSFHSITGVVDIFTSESGITGSEDFGALIVGGNVNLTGQIKGVGDPGASATDNQNTTSASVINVLFGSCSFNGASCLDDPVLVGAAEEIFEFFGGGGGGSSIFPQPPRSDTSTNSLDNTPAQFAFNNDPLEGEFAIDVFGTEFELVETAGGAEGAYTGLNYVFQDFWEFLEDEEAEAAADEECGEGQEAVDGECV